MELINIHRLEEILQSSRLKLLLAAPVSPWCCSAMNKQLLLLLLPARPSSPSACPEQGDAEQWISHQTRVCHLLATEPPRPNHGRAGAFDSVQFLLCQLDRPSWCSKGYFGHGYCKRSLLLHHQHLKDLISDLNEKKLKNNGWTISFPSTLFLEYNFWLSVS